MVKEMAYYCNIEDVAYFYHGDFCGSRAKSQTCLNYTEMQHSVRSQHLGSASWITDRNGKPVQHLQYLPFGEPFVDQHPAGYQERYTFTAKERDRETGYSYFGARYYWSSVLTGWLSVDPMADKYPNISPYNYCMWNPVKLVDYNGEEPVKPLIKYYGGGHFMVNTANLSKSTQSRIAIANYYGAHDEKNIGVNLTIGYYNTPYLKPDNTPYFIPQDGIGVDPEHVIKVKTPEGRLKRNGKPYYNTYGWTSCAKGPGVGRATGLTFLAIDITVNIENTRQLNEVLNDNRELRRQIGLLNEASSMVNTAIKSGIVFNESQASNNDFLGDVINYIYQGTYVSHGGTVSGRRISPEAIKKAKEIMSNNNLKYPLISYPQ